MISLDECSGSFNMNECECFTFIPINSLHVYKNKCYMQDNLDNCDNCAYKIAKNKRLSFFMTMFLKITYYKCCITIELT